MTRKAKLAGLLSGAALSLLALVPPAMPETPSFGTVAQGDPGMALWMNAAWRNFLAAFVTDDGAVQDDANNDISHSEGQGYGMLMAVAAGDRDAFERIRDFAIANLQVREDNLFAWKVERTGEAGAYEVTDSNNATDGDLLIAWALVEAYKRWGNENDARLAADIYRDILSDLVIDTPYGPALLPGMEGFESEDATTFNLSYWVYPAFEAAGSVDSSGLWEGISSSGDALLTAAQQAPSYLPPDWIEINPDGVAPSRQFEDAFGYNAVRIPLYLAFDDDPKRQDLAADFATRQMGGAAVVETSSGEWLGQMQGRGYSAIAALSRCLHDGTPLNGSLLKLGGDNYYPTALQFLTVVLIAERYPSCLSLEH
ncbi:glycosyl hydrolase family 8 [Roseibium sp. RKSG952]|uniref:glycosyl hydrolase family 8 n=1 Tax=Roseibium sp. RKSG952 TaxID=2529384 RepID=UPI0012BB8620|nr:glycosyl hydrolase family 8 [Roseibium sp. RKSG952]MTH99565.1 cellulase [Roseibium sp. RKSG952]